MSKFEAGDLVVVARLTEFSASGKEIYLGKPAIIATVNPGGTYKYHIVSDNTFWLWSDEELEHSALYNSPLYQALL